MRSIRNATAWALALAGLFLALALPAPAQAPETRWAYVENQTGSSIALRYDEIIEGGNKATTGVRVGPGETKALDARTILGEVCAWGAEEYKPAEKIGCRALAPGDRWVIR